MLVTLSFFFRFYFSLVDRSFEQVTVFIIDCTNLETQKCSALFFPTYFRVVNEKDSAAIVRLSKIRQITTIFVY